MFLFAFCFLLTGVWSFYQANYCSSLESIPESIPGSLGNVGEDCFKELFEREKLKIFGMSEFMEFDKSPWFYVSKNPESFKVLPLAAKNTMLKRHHEFCKGLTEQQLLDELVGVTIPQVCFDQIPSAAYEKMTLESVEKLSFNSIAFYGLLEAGIQRISNHLKSWYNRLDFKRPPKEVSTYLTEKDLQINDDFELLFTSSCQIIGDALIRKKTIKVFDKSVDLEGAAPSVLYHTVLKYLMLLKENYPIDSFLLDCFIAHIKSAILFANVSELNDHRILSLITSKLLELIVNDLAEGESIIFPHGYSGTPAHATIMEIKKLPDSKVLLNYFNTGGTRISCPSIQSSKSFRKEV